jgi:hypothetical protein
MLLSRSIWIRRAAGTVTVTSRAPGEQIDGEHTR